MNDFLDQYVEVQTRLGSPLPLEGGRYPFGFEARPGVLPCVHDPLWMEQLEGVGSRQRSEIVPFCAACNERNGSDPRYLRDIIRALFEVPSPTTRLQYKLYCGEETDPIPRGLLTLVHTNDAA